MESGSPSPPPLKTTTPWRRSTKRGGPAKPISQHENLGSLLRVNKRPQGWQGLILTVSMVVLLPSWNKGVPYPVVAWAGSPIASSLMLRAVPQLDTCDHLHKDGEEGKREEVYKWFRRNGRNPSSWRPRESSKRMAAFFPLFTISRYTAPHEIIVRRMNASP